MKNLENEYPINTFSGETQRELLSLFRQAIDEVIGRKEEEVDDDGTFNTGADYRNQLRAEQRARSNQIMPKE